MTTNLAHKKRPPKGFYFPIRTGLRRKVYLHPTNAGLYHYAGNNPVRYIDPDGKIIFMLGGCFNAGCGTGVAENVGIYLITDWKGNVSLGIYSTSSVGGFAGVGASGGGEFTVAFFADEFSDIAGYSLL